MDINFKATILIATSDPDALELMKEMLQGRYHVKLAASGADLLRLARLAPYADAIVLDAGLAGDRQQAEDRGALLRVLCGEAGLAAPLLLVDDAAAEAQAWRDGAADVIVKPLNAVALRARLARQLELAALRAARQLPLAAIGEDNNDSAILAVAALAEAYDPAVGKHLLRTQRLVAALAAQLQYHERFRAALAPADIALIVKAAPLHDIGKSLIDPAILSKPGRLTAEEFAAMQAHAAHGRAAIEAAARSIGTCTPFLRHAADIAGAHQEKWDGSGYPQGLAGEAIPVAARLMAAADVYDALVTPRAYRPAFTHETAVELIRQGRGEHFDPDVADAVLVIEERFRAIAAEFADAA